MVHPSANPCQIRRYDSLKALKAFESIFKARKPERRRRLSVAPLSIHTHTGHEKFSVNKKKEVFAFGSWKKRKPPSQRKSFGYRKKVFRPATVFEKRD